MTAFNPAFLNSMQTLTSNILKSTQQGGLLLYARHQVTLAYPKSVVANPKYGVVSSASDKPELMELDPQPAVEIRDQFRVVDGTTVKLGDALVYNLVQTYTRDQLVGAAFWMIDGRKYKIVPGTLKNLTNGIFWEVILKRMEETDCA